MVKSMTGFGRGAYEDQTFSCTVEMKTVNHRYNEVAIRLPRFLNPLEDRLRKQILATVSRGWPITKRWGRSQKLWARRITLSVSVQSSCTSPAAQK